MSIPVQMCAPLELESGLEFEAESGGGKGGVEEERMQPERPEPQPMSRMWDGVERCSSERARWVISLWMCWMRLEVVYFVAEVVL